MIHILIDLTDLTDEEQNQAGFGIKLFKHKKKEVVLHILGKTQNLLTIDSIDGIEIIEYNASKDKETTLDFIFNSAQEKGCSGIVTFRNKTQRANAAKKRLEVSAPSPLIVSSYPDAYTGKFTLLGDLGYKINPSKEDYLNYLSERKAILEKTNHQKNPSSKLLLPSGLGKNELAESVIAERKKDSSFQGEIGSLKRLEADCDILIGDPRVIQSTISGINQGVTIYNEYLEKGRNTSFQFKFGGLFIKKLMDNFNASVDKKLTSGGRLLYGYKKNIILVRKDTTPNGIAACLNLAYNTSELVG